MNRFLIRLLNPLIILWNIGWILVAAVFILYFMAVIKAAELLTGRDLQ